MQYIHRTMSPTWDALCEMVLEVKSALMLAPTWKAAQNKKTQAQICLANTLGILGIFCTGGTFNFPRYDLRTWGCFVPWAGFKSPQMKRHKILSKSTPSPISYQYNPRQEEMTAGLNPTGICDSDEDCINVGIHHHWWWCRRVVWKGQA